jgi:hypothetical protein
MFAWLLLLQVSDVIEHLPIAISVMGYVWSGVGAVLLYKHLRNGKAYANGKDYANSTSSDMAHVRESLARIETEIEYRPTKDEVGKNISEGMSKVASQMTAALGQMREQIEDHLERRVGPLERRIEANTRWIEERRLGPDDRRGL